jgi:hypothetical protein
MHRIEIEQKEKFNSFESSYYHRDSIIFIELTYDVWNPGPGLGQAQNEAGLNRLMGSQFPPSW